MLAFLRFAGFGAVFSLACWRWGAQYDALLVPWVQALLAILGRPFTVARLESPAPLDLALFTAMVLGARTASGRRIRVWVAGSAALWSSEVVLATLMVWRFTDREIGRPWPGPVDRLTDHLLTSSPWLCAGLAGYLLLWRSREAARPEGRTGSA